MIKKILVLVFLLCGFLARGVSASEIFGNISTNPKNPSNTPGNIADAAVNNSLAAGLDSKDTGKKDNSALNKKESTDNPEENKKNLQAKKEIVIPVEKVAVFGEVFYPDGSLLRGEDKRIYLIMGGAKKHIKNLLELQKYRGKIIYSAGLEELNQYQSRNYLDGELIREKNRAEIYVVRGRGRKYINNLNELRQYYAGQVINNITADEMRFYK